MPDVSMDSTRARHFIVATAGHVDHGKSSLVRALTGVDPDRLPEEKARGITIDLGFAHLQISGHDVSGLTFDIGIIDVPGHEDFVRNMVAGAGSIDLALLVVAADDGWMPQTEEHLQILSYLGVTRGVVVLTKVELASRGVDTTWRLVRQKLADSPFERAPIIPISSVTGQGLDQLQRAMVEVLASAPALPDIGKPRLPIDRVFSLQGIGTVVTGTLRGGCLQQGQEVIIQPTGNVTRIRTLQTHNREVPMAGPGTRVALNLPNSMSAAGVGSQSPDGVERGCVVAVPGLGSAHTICDVLLERSRRLVSGTAGCGRSLKQGSRVRFHAGSCNVPGRIYFSERQELCAGECALAQIRLEAPVYVFTGDRFVLRDWAEQATLAGGVVLNPCGSRNGKRCAGWQATTRASSAGLEPQAAIAAQLQERRAMEKESVLVQSKFSSAEIAEALARLSASGQCRLAGELVLDTGYWRMLNEQARSLIEAAHREHPEQAGVSLATLRSLLSRQLVLPGVFEALVEDLLRTGFSQKDGSIGRTDHRPALPAHLQSAGANIQRVLASKPLDPPSRKELAPDRPSQEALAFLLRAGVVIEVGQEIVLSGKSFANVSEVVRRFLRQHGPATVSDLRQAMGASRRIVVPLLEKLDRQGVTRRNGDRRQLKV